MDVAKTLEHWKGQSPEQWIRQTNLFLPAAVGAVLVLVLAYQLAQLTWAVVPHHTFDRPAPRIVQPGGPVRTGGSESGYSALLGAELFGRAPEGPAEVPIAPQPDAPETTLPLRLTGIHHVSPDNDRGRAIIASSRSEERPYWIDDEIQGTSGVVLHGINIDHVLLRHRDGRIERLSHEDIAETSAVVGRASSRPVPPPPPAMPAANPSADPTATAAAVQRVVRLAPSVEGGEMVGFRVNPGQEREVFDSLGFMPNDVVTEINGLMLNDPSRALEALEALAETNQANVTVIREGSPTVLVIDTTQVQNILEGRQ